MPLQTIFAPGELEILTNAFNHNPKTALEDIRARCKQRNIDPDEQIAAFFLAEKDKLDQQMVGECLAAPKDKKTPTLPNNILLQYARGMKFANTNIVEAFRDFMSGFVMPGEGQVGDRLATAFGEAYVEQNTNTFKEIKNKKGEPILPKDVAWYITYQILALQTNLYSKQIAEKNKTTLDSFKSTTAQWMNLDPSNNSLNKLLEDIYNDVRNKPIKEAIPPIKCTFAPEDLREDQMFNDGLSKLTPNTNLEGLEKVKCKKIDQRGGWTKKDTTITLERGGDSVQLHISKPNWFGRFLGWLGFDTGKPKLEIRPLDGGISHKSRELVAEIATMFSSSKPNWEMPGYGYAYMKKDIDGAYEYYRKMPYSMREEIEVVKQKIKSFQDNKIKGNKKNLPKALSQKLEPIKESLEEEEQTSNQKVNKKDDIWNKLDNTTWHNEIKLVDEFNSPPKQPTKTLWDWFKEDDKKTQEPPSSPNM